MHYFWQARCFWSRFVLKGQRWISIHEYKLTWRALGVSKQNNDLWKHTVRHQTGKRRQAVKNSTRTKGFRVSHFWNTVSNCASNFYSEHQLCSVSLAVAFTFVTFELARPWSNSFQVFSSFFDAMFTTIISQDCSCLFSGGQKLIRSLINSMIKI